MTCAAVPGIAPAGTFVVAGALVVAGQPEEAVGGAGEHQA